MLFRKGDVSQLHLWKPCMILGVSYFLFRWVSLAEYIPVLRVYSLILQMTCFIRASTRTASTPRVMRTRSVRRDHLLDHFHKCFCGVLICKTGSGIWTKCVCYASATLWTQFVIICDSVCCKWISELLVKYNVWCVMLNDAILAVNELVWNSLWLRLTTGIIWAQVRKFERFGTCFCTCALIIWSVLLHSTSIGWVTDAFVVFVRSNRRWTARLLVERQTRLSRASAPLLAPNGSICLGCL
jgi:hypothetical protein